MRELSAREKDLIAEVANWLSSAAYAAQTENEKTFAESMDRLRDSWAVQDCQSNEWSVIYDKCHRS